MSLSIVSPVVFSIVQGWPAHSRMGWRTQKPMRFRWNVDRALPSKVNFNVPSRVPVSVPFQTKVDIVLFVFGGEGQEKAAVASFHLYVSDLRWNGAPDGVSNRRIDAAQNFPIGGPNVAHECDLGFEDERQRPGSEFDRLGGGTFVRTAAARMRRRTTRGGSSFGAWAVFYRVGHITLHTDPATVAGTPIRPALSQPGIRRDARIAKAPAVTSQALAPRWRAPHARHVHHHQNRQQRREFREEPFPACDPQHTEIRSPADGTLGKQCQSQRSGAPDYRGPWTRPFRADLCSAGDHLVLVPKKAREARRDAPLGIHNVEFHAMTVHERLDEVHAQSEMAAAACPARRSLGACGGRGRGAHRGPGRSGSSVPEGRTRGRR